MKHICIFCSASDIDEKYVRPSVAFTKLLVANKYDLVWGGSNTGLMKQIAHTAKMGGSRVIGISVVIFKDVAKNDADEMIITKDLGERKAMMLARSDAFVGLPGGIGTLDEITEILELKKNHIHDKPIVILNIDGFYDSFEQQLTRMSREGFIHRPLSQLIHFTKTPEETMAYLQSYNGST
ncbi:TIGR00730 family Rossman fold protein [Candidatus Microgenomates bacterium]|nr:MAG: TIGR00730 family Rossman fold protein [Candidatus Microgenomates bacterium]